MSSSLSWTRSSYYLLFLINYDAVRIKKPSSYSFGKKAANLLENLEKYDK